MNDNQKNRLRHDSSANPDTNCNIPNTGGASVEILSTNDLKTKAIRLSVDSRKRIKKGGLKSVNSLLKSHNVNYPRNSNNRIASKKLQSDKWWLHQLRRENLQAFEHSQIASGFVGGVSPYISNPSLAIYKQSRINSIESMKSQYIVNTQTSEIKSLYDVQKHTVSNPQIRRNELMARINGTEAVANELGYKAMFYTITTPSRFHARSGRNPNSKYNQSRPIRAQKYLNTLWKRVLAAFKYANVSPVGFRIAEPHKDATPHWHLLLWMPSDQTEVVTEIIRKHALKDNPNERGAKKNRFDVEAINPEKGSAVAYVAKYVSKNIDGYGMDSEEATAANRVVAWASLWEVRQFQQIGCPSVSVWRYLRSLDEEQTGLIEEMRQAAITNDYAQYVRLQGGLLVTTQTQKVKIATRKKQNDKGDYLLNQYGEMMPEKYGLIVGKKVHQLCVKKWEKCAAPNKPEVSSGKGSAPKSAAPWSPLNNYRKISEYDVTKHLIDSGIVPVKPMIRSDRVKLDVSQNESGQWIAERLRC